MNDFPNRKHSIFAECSYRDHCLTLDLEYVSLGHSLLFDGLEISNTNLCQSRNEINVIIYAACLPTLMPIFKYCSETISRWSVSGPPSDNSNNFSEAIRLGSLDGKISRPKKIFSSLPSEDGRIVSDRHIDRTHILEPDFMGHSEEV